MVHNESLELADQVGVAAEREVCLDPFLEGKKAKLLEPRALAHGKRLRGELGQRGTAPECERLLESS